MKALTIAVISCIAFVVLYTVVAILIQIFTNKILDPSLTVGVFGLFGTELAVSGFIKIFKIKKGE
jgi:hypothetical protein